VVVELLHADVADAAVRAAVGAQDVARDALLEHALEAVVQRIVLRLHAQVDVFPVADFGDHVVVEHVWSEEVDAVSVDLGLPHQKAGGCHTEPSLQHDREQPDPQEAQQRGVVPLLADDAAHEHHRDYQNSVTPLQFFVVRSSLNLSFIMNFYFLRPIFP